jgi:DNA modification methylase
MRRNFINQVNILNPKRSANKSDNYFQYYAGFSSQFAKTIIKSIKSKTQFTILDPWNGSGTTTKSGSFEGYDTIGIDLNPVMIIVAKSNLLNKNDFASIWPIAIDITNKALKNGYIDIDVKNDPLSMWFKSSSVEDIRRIERAIQLLLINPVKYESLTSESAINNLSSLASFYYVALFKCVRTMLKPFISSNPTWIKKADSFENKLNPSMDFSVSLFRSTVISLIELFKTNTEQFINEAASAAIMVGSSNRLNLPNNSVDFILTSPPYCTRIDYAIATLPELAILGYSEESIDSLRRLLIGTSTVPKETPEINPRWGQICNEFLNVLYNHSSKASRSYYYKNHVQYFHSIYNSLSELNRVLKPGSFCMLVVQDSYYKDIHNDLPRIFIEMGQNTNLKLRRKEDFRSERSMSGINYHRTRYRNNSSATESVLCFTKS